MTTTTSSIHNSSHNTVSQVRVGSTVHMSVIVESSGTATGTVQVRRYANGTCSGTAAQLTSATLKDGAVDVVASAYKTVALGSVSFRAKYLGSSSYSASTGACKAVTVIKAVPAITYTVHDASHDALGTEFPIGTDIHPLVKVSGAASTPTGSIQVFIYASSPFEPPCMLSPVHATGALSGGKWDATTVHRSFSTPSTGYVKAYYAGNSLYVATEGPCMKVTWKARASLQSSVTNLAGAVISSVKVGTDVRLAVATDGSFGTPGGQVRIKLWNSSTCSGTAAVDRTVTLGVDGEAALRVTTSTVGTRAYQATYLGDEVYLTGTSSCRTFKVLATAPATPAPTATPVATPQATIVVPATPRPTTVPGATSARGATTAPGATGGPAATPLVTAVPGSSAPPAETQDPSATAGPAETGQSGEPGASGPVAPTPVTSAAPVSNVDEGDGTTTLLFAAVVVLGIGLLLVGIAAGVLLSQRSRRTR